MGSCLNTLRIQNWQKADQLTVYKGRRGVEPGTGTNPAGGQRGT